jgi:predicted transcriptional regulator
MEYVIMASMWDPAGRRSSIQIIADMLKISRSGEPSKTEIMNTVNMSYFQIQRYLTWLTQLGMINMISSGNNNISYKISAKGLRLLSTLEDLQEMLRRKELLVNSLSDFTKSSE